jgi:hypothetical protein
VETAAAVEIDSGGIRQNFFLMISPTARKSHIAIAWMGAAEFDGLHFHRAVVAEIRRRVI